MFTVLHTFNIFNPKNVKKMHIICIHSLHCNYRVLSTKTSERPLTSVDIMSDGITVATGSTNGKIYLYDLRKGNTPIKILDAHKSSVQSLKFQTGGLVRQKNVCSLSLLKKIRVVRLEIIIFVILFFITELLLDSM